MLATATTRGTDTPQSGTSAYNRIEPGAKNYAHRLRRALAGAVELHTGGKWGRCEIEVAGIAGYQREFGTTLSERHFWRIFGRVTSRDGGKNQFQELGLYLPENYELKKPTLPFERLARQLPGLAIAVQAVRNVLAPTETELLSIWDNALKDYQSMVDGGCKEVRAKRTVVTALHSSGLPLARSREALHTTFNRKLERWFDGGCRPSAIRDRRKEGAGRPPPAMPTEEDIKLLIAHSVSKGSVSRAWREALRDQILSSGLVQAYAGNSSSKSYVPGSIARLIRPEASRLLKIHHGPRQAKLNGAFITRDWSTVSPGDWYQADDTTAPLYYWEDDEQGVSRIMRGQLLPMIDVRTNRILAFALHSERNYTAAVIRGLILRTHDTYGLPRRGFYFENGIWRSSRLLRGAERKPDLVDPAETELGLREFVEFKHALPGNARAKPVERVIGIIQDKMEEQPGYCGRDEKTERFERVQAAKLAVERGAEHPSKHFLHRDQWIERLAEICDLYNHEPQEGRLRGQSPIEAWNSFFDFESPLLRLTAETRYLLSNHRRPERVGRNGVCIRIGKMPHYFRNELTGRLIGTTVQAYFDPEDLSSIFIKTDIRDPIAAVIPASPSIPAMDASPEQLQEALGLAASHNRAARTRYRELEPYFPDTRPQPFRPVVADRATVELGQEISAQQEATRAAQNKRARAELNLSRLRNEYGAVKSQGAVSAERQIAAYQFLREATSNANKKTD